MRSVNPDSTTRGCPLRRSSNIIECAPWRNEEAVCPQALGALFDRVLRKKHARSTGPRQEPQDAGWLCWLRWVFSCKFNILREINGTRPNVELRHDVVFL